MFNMCSEVVEGRKKSSPAYDTTKILNELLANDAWLEQVNKTKLTSNEIIAGNVRERFIIATKFSENIFKFSGDPNTGCVRYSNGWNVFSY